MTVSVTQGIAPEPLNRVSTAFNAGFTLAAGDERKYFWYFSPSDATVTIPADATYAFAVGTRIPFTALLAGKLTFTSISVTVDPVVQSGETVWLVKTAADVWWLERSYSQRRRTLQQQTSDYTIVFADTFREVEMNKATAITLTIPTNATTAFAIGTEIPVSSIGAGLLTIAGAGGVTVNGDLTLAQYGACSIVKTATNTWMVRRSGIAKALLTTKGDIIAATAASTPDRVAVGTNYQALGADSSASTGVAWQASSRSVMTTAGDQIIATAANTPARLAIGTPGQAYLVDDSSGKIAWALDPMATSSYAKPTGSLAQTTIRAPHDAGNANMLSTGRLSLVAISLAKGQVVTSISWLSATTALSVGSNQWFGIFGSDRVMKKVTGDDTSTAWAANTVKTLNLSSTYTATYTGLYYIGICVVATTVPTLRVNSNNVNLTGIAPILSGTSDTGLTNPASCPSTAAALTAVANVPYGYVS